MSKHTPTPWSTDTDHIEIEIISGEKLVATVADLGSAFETRANGEFIVRACNAYQDLLEALKGELAPSRSDCNDRNCGACSRCRSRAAISKAESR